MAALMGFIFYGLGWCAYIFGSSEVAYYSFGILANIWWAAAYIARARS